MSKYVNQSNPPPSNHVKAHLRFFAELNDFLPNERKFTWFEVTFPNHSSVKHLIESIGVPHTEIDLIFVNGSPVLFNYIPSENDRICIYPVFESLDITSLANLRPKPLRDIRFILDTHLGKLAIYLRMLGFDCVYQNDFADKNLAERSILEKRLLLTRDLGLLKRKQVTHAYYIRSSDPKKQLIELIQRFDLIKLIHPFSRCLECNQPLEAVSKSEIIHRLLPDTLEYYTEFSHCSQCDRIYWKGNHYQRMQEFLDDVLSKCQ